MKGLSIKATEAIEKLIHTKFDALSLQFLGLIPQKTKEKRIVFSTSRQNLISLFLQGLGDRDPNQIEEQTLKKLMKIASGYLDALKDRTAAKVIADIDAYVTNQNAKRETVSGSEINKIIEDDMKRAKNHFKMIANSESNKAVNTGTALQISKMADEKKEEDPTVFFIVTIDDATGPEEFVLHLLPDKKTPRVWKLSEIGSEYHKKGDPNPKLPGLHPNCFVGNLGVNILTEKYGYKNIKDIKIGDRVLTHTGKFKRVLNTLSWYDKKYHGKFVKIKYKSKDRDGYRDFTLKLTPDHELLTDRGWVRAIDITSTDKLRHLYTSCKTCGKKTYVKPKRKGKDKLEGYFCSRSCVAKYQWEDEKHVKNISEKSSRFMKEKWKKPTEDMYDNVRKMNVVTSKLIEKGEFWAQKKENLEILQKNIAKINQKLQTNRKSKEEAALYSKVKDIFPTAKEQHILEKWCVDIFIPELKVNIEYDGGGHYLPVYTGKHTMESFLSKQEGRDIYLEKCGYHILRYNTIPSDEQIKQDVMRVAKNSNSEYCFDDIEITSVEVIKNGKAGYKLYDITVEDDESFVVNGIVSHNCRCKLTYLAAGWGFDKSGHVKYIGPDHDEFVSQREKYGLPR